MTDTIPPARPRGRPRAFCTDAALDTAEALFAAQGYEAVSVADLCASIGIKPPSFYAAFGAKQDLFARVVDRYAEGRGGGVLRDALAPHDDPAEAVRALLLAAADAYAKDARGCLVMEAGTGEGAGACAAAAERTAAMLRDRLGEDGAALASVALRGLSGAARDGADRQTLRDFARLAGKGIAARL